MNCIDTAKTYIADVKVTTQTYKLYQDVLTYDDGTEIAHYVLRSAKDSKKYWYGVPAGKSGEYYFQTMTGTVIKRGGNKVIFFIAGDTITRIK